MENQSGHPQGAEGSSIGDNAEVIASSALPGGGGEVGKEGMARIAVLKSEERELSMEFDAPGMSKAKAYAVKKKLQMKRAAIMREERALKQTQAKGSV